MNISTQYISDLRNRECTGLSSLNSNRIIHLKPQQLFSKASELNSYRVDNFQRFVGEIFKNMGFENTRDLTSIVCSQSSLEGISKTSELGRVLKEFGVRERAFERIALDAHFVSEMTLDDVAVPISKELRKKASQQAREFLSGPHIDKSAKDPVNEHILNKIYSKLTLMGSSIASFLDYLNVQVLNLPSASAAREPDFKQSEPANFLVADPSPTFDSESLKTFKENIKNEIEKLKGKQVISFTGFTGAGKSTFINYLFSKSCGIKNMQVVCDKMIAASGGGNRAVTKFLTAYQTKGQTDNFPDEVVFVDFPGFLGRTGNRADDIVHSMYIYQGMAEIKKAANSTLNIVVIDFQTVSAQQGASIKDLISILDLKEKREDVFLVISKVPRLEEVKKTKTKMLPPATKRDIEATLKQDNLEESLVQSMIVYDIEDKEIAESLREENGVEMEVIGGGGANRTNIIEKFMEKLNSSKTDNQSKTFVSLDRKTSKYIEDMKENIKITIEQKNINNLIKLMSNIDILADGIDIIEINNMLSKELIDSLIKKVVDTTKIKFKNMIKIGDTTSFTDEFNGKLLRLINYKRFSTLFNQTQLIDSFVASINETTELPNNVSDSLGSILAAVGNHLEGFNQKLKNNFEYQLSQINSSFINATNDCKQTSQKELESLKKFNKILGLNLNQQSFDELDKIYNSTTQIFKIYKKNLGEVVESTLLNIFFSSAILSLLLYAKSRVEKGSFKDVIKRTYTGKFEGLEIDFEVGDVRDDSSECKTSPKEYLWKLQNGKLTIDKVNPEQNSKEIVHLVTENGKTRYLNQVYKMEHIINSLKQMESNIIKSNAKYSLSRAEWTLVISCSLGILGNISLGEKLVAFYSLSNLPGYLKRFIINQFWNIGLGGSVENWYRKSVCENALSEFSGSQD